MDIIKHSMRQRLNMVRYMYSHAMLNMHSEDWHKFVKGGVVKTPYYLPLFFHFPTDVEAHKANQQNNVMLGEALKLSVVADAVGKDTEDFYFPAGTWCSMWQNIGAQACFNSVGEKKTMASKAYDFYVHLREGSIVPM